MEERNNRQNITATTQQLCKSKDSLHNLHLSG
jgi:hypothetical protein